MWLTNLSTDGTYADVIYSTIQLDKTLANCMIRSFMDTISVDYGGITCI